MARNVAGRVRFLPSTGLAFTDNQITASIHHCTATGVTGAGGLIKLGPGNHDQTSLLEMVALPAPARPIGNVRKATSWTAATKADQAG